MKLNDTVAGTYQAHVKQISSLGYVSDILICIVPVTRQSSYSSKLGQFKEQKYPRSYPALFLLLICASHIKITSHTNHDTTDTTLDKIEHYIRGTSLPSLV